jgi:hypothetical protein
MHCVVWELCEVKANFLHLAMRALHCLSAFVTPTELKGQAVFALLTGGGMGKGAVSLKLYMGAKAP